MEIVRGVITKWGEDGTVLIRAPLPDIDRAILRQYHYAAVGFDDGRTISPEQRRKCYALLGEISEWSMGSKDELEYIKNHMKLEFITNRLKSIGMKMFSLSDCSVTTAREFINYLIDFIVEFHIPTSRPLVEYAEDIQRYMYACAVHKVCCICGREHADLHHEPPIGMGLDRNKIHHVGRTCCTLCRVHHTERHTIGAEEFMEKYHIEPVVIDKKIAKVNNLKP